MNENINQNMTCINQTGKTTMIKRVAVRETSISLHIEGSIKSPPETPRTSQHYGIEGFK